MRICYNIIHHYTNLECESLQELKDLPNKYKIINFECESLQEESLDLRFKYKIINFECESLQELLDLKNKYKVISLTFYDLDNTILDIEFNKFILLLQLTIWGTNLISLPSLESCIDLEKLNIWDNKNLTSLPSLESCINLQILRISENTNLTSIPSLEKCINLQDLTIYGNNKIKSLPKGIQYLTKLKYYKCIENTKNNQYPENERIPELIHYTIREKYYYTPIMKYYTKNYLK